MIRPTCWLGIEEVSEQDWTNLVGPDAVIDSYAFLEFREQMSSPGFYLIDRPDGSARMGEIRGAVAVRVVADESGAFARPARTLISPSSLRLELGAGPARKLAAKWCAAMPHASIHDVLRALRQRFAELLLPAALIYAPLETRIHLKRDLPPGEAADVADRLLDEAHVLAYQNGCKSVLFLGTRADDKLIARLCAERGYVSAFFSMAATFQLHNFSSFGEFVSGLTAKQRYRFQRAARDFAASGLVVRQVDGKSHARDCARLEMNVMTKYGTDRDVEFMTRMKTLEFARLGDVARLYGCFDGDDLVASAICYTAGRRVILTQYGADYGRITGIPVYPYLCYHIPIEAAIADGADEFCCGFESYRAKLLRGAVLDGRTVHVHASGSDARHFARDLLQIIDQRNRQYFSSLGQVPV